MQEGSGLYWLFQVILTVLIAWIVLSLVILWFRPEFIDASGAVNWWTTLWVAVVVLIFAWLFALLLRFIFGLFKSDPQCC